MRELGQRGVAAAWMDTGEAGAARRPIDRRRRAARRRPGARARSPRAGVHQVGKLELGHRGAELTGRAPFDATIINDSRQIGSQNLPYVNRSLPRVSPPR
jgi:hypothetical protein